MPIETDTPLLVVDDQSVMLDLIVMILQGLGFTDVDHASDGEGALRKLRAKAYGLVISDWRMEPMSGLQLLRAVRADPDLRATPFIMTTASLSTEGAVAAKYAGVDNYVLKPFSPSVLKAKIDAIA